MFNYVDLYSKVFDKSVEADKLIIITGYVGPAVVQDLKKLPYDIELYIGMYGSVISPILHKSLLKSNSISNLNIYYTNMLVHAKCYIWLKEGNIVRALIGSANFSTSGLMTPNKEVLADIQISSYNELLCYIELIRDSSYSVIDYKPSAKENTIRIFDDVTQSISDKEVEISLLATKGGGSQSNIIGISTLPGEVHAGAGLNWGFSNAMPKPNDAYIKLPKDQINSNPLMFPPKNKDYNDPIDVIWDDGTEMQMLLEGTQFVNDVAYPKQISSYKNKKELGIYLRTRIGNAIGKDLVIPEQLSKDDFVLKANYYKDKFVTKEMLEEYGRTSINIKLIEDRTYYFDFSNNKKED